MKVFIENEQHSAIKHIFDERNLTFIKVVPVSAPYPYPYGFITETLSGDGDCLDCFVITDEPLRTNDVIEVEPLALMEMLEDGEIDHKVLAKLPHENIEIDEQVKQRIVDFIDAVFAHIPDKRMEVGEFLPKARVQEFLKQTREAFLRDS